MSGPILRVERISRHFKAGRERIKAVDGVSFSVEKGEIFAIVGESGSGKTTVGRAIVGLHPLTAGEIFLHGKRLAIGRGHIEEDCEEMRRQTAQKIVAWKAEMHAFKERRIECVHKIKKARKKRRAYLLSQSAGYRVAKREIQGEKRRRAGLAIQMIFQDPLSSLNPKMTVGEIVEEGLKIGGVKDGEYRKKKVAEMLSNVGLASDSVWRYPHEFSGGQRQRIGIARALIVNPEIVVADEPVSALDVSVQAQVLQLLLQMRKERGLTMLFTSHDLSVVRYMADRIAVMYLGKIVELAPKEALFTKPMHPYTKALLSSVPETDGTGRFRKVVRYEQEESDRRQNAYRSLTEVADGHFVFCNSAELVEYKKAYAKSR